MAELMSGPAKCGCGNVAAPGEKLCQNCLAKQKATTPRRPSKSPKTTKREEPSFWYLLWKKLASREDTSDKKKPVKK